MKKLMMLAGLCLMVSISAVAQDFQGNRQGRGPRRQMDAVVDTAIINHMNLDEAVLQKVYQLQEAKAQEQRESMGQTRQRGQRMSEEDRQAFMDKMQAFKTQYRKDLRAIIGDDAYILYLEKSLDNRAMNFMRGGQGRPMGGQRPMGGDFNGGGFGGGFDNGGGF